MKNLWQKNSFKAFTAVIAVVCVVSLICNFGYPFLSSGTNLLAKGLFQVSAAVTDSFSKPSYEELEEKAEALEEENAQLRSQLADYYDIKTENEQLWKFYDIKKENPSYTYVPATVIRRDANDDFYSFTIDAGDSMGIKVNDPVITENGLVGMVVRCDASTAKVKTLLSPEIKVGAEDVKTEDIGIITGNAELCDSNLTTLTKISSENTMEQGNVIATSGAGGLFPPNLIIGKIKEISFDDYDATKYAVVEPYEDIRRVQGVLVITDFESKGQITLDKSADAKGSEENTSAQEESQPTT